MTDMKKLLHTFDEADEILNDKIDRTNLSTIVASATASVENKKTVLIRGTGRNIEVLKVGGKTVQNGTPTPTNPVEVKGVGDKSKNLCDPNKVDKDNRFSYENGAFVNTVTDERTSVSPIVYRYNASGTVGTGMTYNYTSGTYSVNVVKESTFIGIVFGHSGSTKDLRIKVDMSSCTNGKTYTLSFKMSGNPSVVKSFKISDVQLEEGSTPTPYEPYYTGYKIPILTDGKSQNIYLDAPLFDGEIADLVKGTKSAKFNITVLTGDESNWQMDKAGLYRVAGAIDSIGYTSPGFCTHFPKFGSTYNELYDGGKVAYNNSTQAIIFSYPAKTTLDDFRAFVREQYSKGTPITVISVKTATASETFEDTEIPVSAAETELTINTEITPSSIEAVTFGDYYTKAEVDKMMSGLNEWTTTNILATDSYSAARFNLSQSNMTMHYNALLNKVVVTYSLVTSAEMTTSESGVAIGVVPLEKYNPIANVRSVMVSKNGYSTSIYKGNTTNNIVFSVPMGTCPSGSSVTGMLEWQLF